MRTDEINSAKILVNHLEEKRKTEIKQEASKTINVTTEELRNELS